MKKEESLQLVSDDERRALYELGSGGSWKVCKYLVAKEDCVVGDHWHKKKDELFLLIHGSGTVATGDIYQFIDKLMPGNFIFVPRGTQHRFRLSAGSRLLCLATEEHDPSDDHKKD